MKPNLLISFSGGETSAYMTKHILESESDKWGDIVVVFANTGKENEETLEFINKCDKAYGFNTVWIESVFNKQELMGYKIVDFETADRKGGVFESMMVGYGLPNQAFPHCTRELKTRPIQKFAKDMLGVYHTAIGIRADEVDRVDSNYLTKRYYYPLVSKGITRQHINHFWSTNSFRLNLKGYEGNCDACWKKSTRKLMTIAKNNPERFDWWREMENKFGEYVPEHRARNSDQKPISFYRNKIGVDGIFELVKEPFTEAVDDTKNSNYQTDMFNEFLDRSSGCEESCEPF